MISILLIGFLIGFLSPIIARRFAKFMPADPASAFIECFHIPMIPKNKNHPKFAIYKMLIKRLLISCLITGILSSISLGLIYARTENYWYLLLFSILILITAIDLRLYILPDILTVPLLLMGFAVNYFFNFIPVYDSIIGSLAGYFGVFIIGIIVYFIKPQSFGGGDYKTLAGIGAWLGLYGLCYAIFFSSILGLIIAGVTKSRGIAYGLPLTLGVLLVILFNKELMSLFS